MLTAEQIAHVTRNCEGIKNINAIYRAQDESHLFPINNKFNATERAIRQVRKHDHNGGLEYCYLIENMLSTIVNGEI